MMWKVARQTSRDETIRDETIEDNCSTLIEDNCSALAKASMVRERLIDYLLTAGIYRARGCARR
jgi:hypothetical protein